MNNEIREKISKSRKGIKFSDEHIKNLSKSHMGYIVSEKTKQKLKKPRKIESRIKQSITNKGRIVKEETKQKMSLSAKNRGISKENQIKMLKGRKKSNKIIGVKRSEETKSKMKEAWIKRKQFKIPDMK